MLLSLLPLALVAAPAAAPWEQSPSVPPQLLEGPAARLGDAPPRRVVSLAPSATELVFALGEGARVVGVTRYDDEPAEVRSLARVGGFLDPNLEAVLALRPELVLAAPNREIRPRLERLVELGVPVLVLPGNALQDVWWSTRALAPRLGPAAEERGRALLARLERSLVEVRDRPRAARRPRVALVYGQEPLVLAGPGSFAHQLLELAGAENVVRIERAHPIYSMEQLVVDAPELVIDATSEHGRGLGFWEGQLGLDAVRNGRVHALTGTALLRAGPRVAEALRELAKRVDAGMAKRRP